MSRISKSSALQRAATNITRAAGADGRTSRAELKTALTSLKGPEQKLTEVFFRFVDHRDFRAGAQVTKTDIDRAVRYAKETLVAKYDLNRNGLSAAEMKSMSLTGKLAVDLARELKAAGSDPIDKHAFLEKVQFSADRTLTNADLSSISPALAKQIITACHEASYSDVKTLADAFEAVDNGEIFVREGTDRKTNAKYLAVDFGAGSNVAGAIFKAGSNRVAYSIQDGEFYAP
jgi:hypothetical protein